MQTVEMDIWVRNEDLPLINKFVGPGKRFKEVGELVDEAMLVFKIFLDLEAGTVTEARARELQDDITKETREFLAGITEGAERC